MEVVIHPDMAGGYRDNHVRDIEGCFGPWEQKDLVSNRGN